MASTHGDHTVKITCAHTGELIRTLEGHPRTPWTVKYHPTNHNIVASGCLGFQVRIWDWNYRTEESRGKWRRENERRYGGRYTVAAGDYPVVWKDGRCCSPRGVMEGSSWRGGRSKRQHNKSHDNTVGIIDDYAASGLEELGIPTSDPAWYEIDSKLYNYQEGTGVCLSMIRLSHAIISLAFHPSGDILAVASGSTLHLWDYDEEGRKARKRKFAARLDVSTREGNSHLLPQERSLESRILRSSPRQESTSRTITISHESALRCVHFPPSGDSLIIGGVNPTSANEGLANRHPRGSRGGMSGGGMSFHLRLWDFDPEAVLNPPAVEIPGGAQQVNGGGHNATSNLGGQVTDEGEVTWNFSGERRPLSDVSLTLFS